MTLDVVISSMYVPLAYLPLLIQIDGSGILMAVVGEHASRMRVWQG